MHHEAPLPRLLSALGPAEIELALLSTVDLALVLDTDLRVQALQVGPGLHLPGTAGWPGRPFASLVCKASQGKLQSLFGSANGSRGRDDRWRHLNVLTRGDSIPMLVKYFGFDGPAGGQHLILARDLRPTQAMQVRVQRALVEFEQAVEDRRSVPDPADPRLSDASARVGQRPLAEIVADMARRLERLCLEEALRRSAGDPVQASRLLGIDRAELEARLRQT